MKTKNKKTSAVHVGSACTSLVCMAQMGTMTVAGTAGAGAMGAMSAASAGSVPFITLAFQAIGLGFLLVFPQIFYQMLLIIILGFTILFSYFSYKFHKNPGIFTLTLISSFLLYSSIYLFISEPLYWIAFLLMLVSAGWSYKTEKIK